MITSDQDLEEGKGVFHVDIWGSNTRPREEPGRRPSCRTVSDELKDSKEVTAAGDK